MLDGEKVFRAAPARAAMSKVSVKLLEGWPPHSPDLNSAEHVWTRAEVDLRKMEPDNCTFEEFGRLVKKAVLQYPAPEKLVGSIQAYGQVYREGRREPPKVMWMIGADCFSAKGSCVVFLLHG